MSIELTVGGDDGKGHKVATILGESPVAVVYTTTDNHLRWMYHQNNGIIPLPLAPARSRFDSLMTDIGTFVPIKHKVVAYTHLGKAFFAALDVGVPEHINDAFASVEQFVKQARLQYARVIYLRTFLIASAIAIASGAAASQFPLRESVSECLIGAMFGVVGSCISVLQRSASLDLEVSAGAALIAFQGAARSVLGAVFGLFVVLASLGDLVLGLAKHNILALAALAVVGGVSERYVPEIIEKLQGMS